MVGWALVLQGSPPSLLLRLCEWARGSLPPAPPRARECTAGVVDNAGFAGAPTSVGAAWEGRAAPILRRGSSRPIVRRVAFVSHVPATPTPGATAPV